METEENKYKIDFWLR